MIRIAKPLMKQLEAIWTVLDNGGSGGIGPQGPQGPVGPQGPAGVTGPPGQDGSPGLDGQTGPAGPKGDTGDQGATGQQGPQGNDGSDGSTGPQGATGPQGTQGVQGIKGDKGDKGDTGDAGPTGSQGPAGADSVVPGPTGPQGPQGAQGIQGIQGPTGPQGADGDAGPQGETGPAGSDANVTNANVNTAIIADRPATKTALVLVKGDVGLGNADNTADANKAVLTATKLATPRNINGVAFDGSGNITINAVDSTARVAETRTISTTAPITGGGDLSANRTIAISAATTGAAGSMSASDKTKLDGVATGATSNSSDATLLARANHTGTQSLDTTTDSATRLAMTSAQVTKLSGIATGATANSTDAALSAFYRTLLDSSGSHTAAKVAGTYGLGQGDPLAVSGTGTLYPLNVIYIDAADYPAIGALTAKLRVRAIIECNDVAPTGNFTIGLHAVTRPGTSGGAGLVIYTMAAAVASSTATATTPAADSQTVITSSDFAVPATGYYVLGVVTTGTIATSAHVHVSAALQMRYS